MLNAKLIADGWPLKARASRIRQLGCGHRPR